MLWVSIHTEVKEGTETLPDHARMDILWGIRGEQDDQILSMHLESHTGKCSAPLFDFNGKALWEHAPQEMSKMKCVGWWLEVNGCFSFLFFSLVLFSLLAFSLVYFVGLVSQSSDIPLSRKSQIHAAFHAITRGHSDHKTFRPEPSASWRGESDRCIEFEQTHDANMNRKMPTHTHTHRVHWSMGSVWFPFTLSRNEIFVFTWIFSFYLSVTQPQIVTRGSDELQEQVVVTSNICTCSSEGLHFFSRRSRAFSPKTT